MRFALFSCKCVPRGVEPLHVSRPRQRVHCPCTQSTAQSGLLNQVGIGIKKNAFSGSAPAFSQAFASLQKRLGSSTFQASSRRMLSIENNGLGRRTERLLAGLPLDLFRLSSPEDGYWIVLSGRSCRNTSRTGSSSQAAPPLGTWNRGATAPAAVVPPNHHVMAPAGWWFGETTTAGVAVQGRRQSRHPAVVVIPPNHHPEGGCSAELTLRGW